MIKCLETSLKSYNLWNKYSVVTLMLNAKKDGLGIMEELISPQLSKGLGIVSDWIKSRWKMYFGLRDMPSSGKLLLAVDIPLIILFTFFYQLTS